MKKRFTLKTSLLISLLTLPVANHANSTSEVLVTVDDEAITASDLNQALSSSPFYTQFNTMSRDDQASLRGDVLRRLVASQLLRLEAQAQKLDSTAEFQHELEAFRTGILYRRYMDHLRQNIKIPPEKLRQMKQDFQSQPDALAAAKSSFVSSQYRGLHDLTIRKLRDQFNVKIHDDRISNTTSPDTVLLEGDQGIRITFGELLRNPREATSLSKDQVLDRLYQKGELLLVAKAAEREKLDISDAMKKYREERLPALLLEKKEKAWIPDEKVLKDYFDGHPELGVVPERWHIGQIVLKTKGEAEKVAARLAKGESLFVLAGQMSIDPYGKSKSGDMGWVKQGTGHPAIEAVLKDLKDSEISQIAETPMGFHILTIIDRRPGSKQRFNGFQDKIRQIVLSEKLSQYIATLQEKHDIKWLVVQNPDNSKQTGEKK
jgi:peptidyl-prolyl cis-trans isomerase C